MVEFPASIASSLSHPPHFIFPMVTRLSSACKRGFSLRRMPALPLYTPAVRGFRYRPHNAAQAKKNTQNLTVLGVSYGAADQIRTGDLILTNHRRAFQPLLYKALRRFFVQKGRGRSLFVPLFPSAHFPVWVTVWVKRTPPRQRNHGQASPSYFVLPFLARN